MNTLAIGRRARQRREDIGLRQSDVADGMKRLGLSCDLSTISKFENNKSSSDPGYEFLRTMARVLNVSMTWLIEGDDPDVTRAISRLASVDAIGHALARMSNWYLQASIKGRMNLEQHLTALADTLDHPEVVVDDVKFESPDGTSEPHVRLMVSTPALR